MDHAAFKIRSKTTRSTGVLPIIIRVLVVIAGGIALLAMFLIGLFVVFPLLLAGGTALYFYLRRRVRHAQPYRRAQTRPEDDTIEVDYTVIERRHQNGSTDAR
jgi:hypothetical protein